MERHPYSNDALEYHSWVGFKKSPLVGTINICRNILRILSGTLVIYCSIFRFSINIFFPVTSIMPASFFGVGETGEECGSARCWNMLCPLNG